VNTIDIYALELFFNFLASEHIKQL